MEPVSRLEQVFEAGQFAVTVEIGPPKGVDVSHLAVLFDELRRRSGLRDGDRLAAHEERMWAHLEDLQTRCANTFEPSMTWDGQLWSFYRYTYSFHDGDPQRWSADAAVLWRMFMMPAT